MNTAIETNAVLPEHTGDPDTLHIFMLVKSTRHWLDLENEKRQAFFEDVLKPLLAARPEVRLRFFDAEAFTTAATDVLLWETKSISAWMWIADHLRETLFWDHFFEVREILPSLEGNYFEEESSACA